MAKKHKLSYLLTAWTALAVSALLSSCKPVVVPTDSDMLKSYQNNYKDFAGVVGRVMAEENQKFSVIRGQSVTYQGSDKPPVSNKTLTACQQLMGRTFCLATRRNGGTIQFVFYEDNGTDAFRSKSLIYDRDGFKDPIWKAKTSDTTSLRYAPVQPPTDLSRVPDKGPPQQLWTLEYRYERHKP